MINKRLFRILGLIIINCQLSIVNLYAQKAGDIISGTVTDNLGPVMMANVVELDAANRIVASAVIHLIDSPLSW